MKTIKQVCAFMENRQGQLAELLEVLSVNGIDLRALNVAETTDYGVARLIADNSGKAAEVLKNAGCIVSLNEVFAVSVPDRPGGLKELLEKLASDGVDIEYMYSVFGHKNGLAYMIVSAKNMECMQESLDKNQIIAADSKELGLC